MAIYQLDIQKHIGTEYWTNVWHWNLSAAPTDQRILDFCNRESGFHYSNVIYDKCLFRSYPTSAGIFVEYVLNYPGARTGNADIPLFNVARSELRAANGKPGIKMFRGALSETDIENLGATTAAVRTTFEGLWDDLFEEFPELCKVSGTLLLDGALSERVGMRQLKQRRGKPVI